MSLAKAIATGELAELPSRRQEDWRWTDLRGLVRTLPPASLSAAAPTGPGPFAPVASEEIVVVNGQGPSRLVLAPGETRCVALRFVSAGAGAHAARMVVKLDENADLVLLESYEGEGDYLTETDLDFTIGAGARLERVVIAVDAPDAISVSQARIALGPVARLAQTVLTSGAKRQRLETRVAHPGAGASVRLDGLYLLADRRHADITTIVEHAGVDGATNQLIKGAVRDQARGVFQGRIVVQPGADRTEARMGHHALVLSDRAEVDAKPELEIWADDVVCAHGNTVGALDEEALFYAGQRGLPEGEARAMLTVAFLAEVVDRIGHDGARACAHAWLAARSGAQS